MSHLAGPFALSDNEAAELKARHLACSHLVKGCQDAIITFRKTSDARDSEQAHLAHRSVEILEEVMDSWCDTLSVLRSALNQTSSIEASSGQRLEPINNVLTNESYWKALGLPAEQGRQERS